ncbi:unnamed protein product [Clonostachys solani]|uniref:DNA replication regulator SLD2 n=1 Tax=Clonostachys solani TaxID=160281 RepID=A0A9N9W206_9HYPO|nr:unnamed protein product [Clonostachys solani]
MDSQTKSEYEAKCAKLRLDLKKWESDWAKAHGGKKPGRDDIKSNAEIAQKYRHYQKCRDILDGKAPVPPPKDETRSRKHRTEHPPSETPLKKAKFAETPSNNRIQDPNDLATTPSISRKLFSPSGVTSLGPTPQRDGRVLGLFDLLVEKEIGTPSKTEMGVRSEVRGDVGVTPRKQRAVMESVSSPELTRSPMSASKRQMLDTFMTPLKKRNGNPVGAVTPSSVSKLQFETPQFLKRHSLPVVDEDENNIFGAPAPLRLPRKPLGRGLSEIVASLRRIEEDELDEDLDALRAVEDEELGRPIQPQKPAPNQSILAKDAAAEHLPLGGFDDEGLYDSPVEDEKDRDGNPRKIFKKKGQKRTTRKANIKPVWTKRPVEDAGGEEGQDQLASGDNDDFQPQSEAESGDDRHKEKQKKNKPKTSKESTKGVVKRAARKVNELAHANFQRLKLRQNGAKGGPGYNSRFRRRR